MNLLKLKCLSVHHNKVHKHSLKGLQLDRTDFKMKAKGSFNDEKNKIPQIIEIHYLAKNSEDIGVEVLSVVCVTCLETARSQSCLTVILFFLNWRQKFNRAKDFQWIKTSGMVFMLPLLMSLFSDYVFLKLSNL